MDTNLIEITSDQDGGVVLYLKDPKAGGPIVKGKDLLDALQKWEVAFALFRFTTSSGPARAYFSA